MPGMAQVLHIMLLVMFFITLIGQVLFLVEILEAC